jgi:ribosomal protein L11 methyltransferase
MNMSQSGWLQVDLNIGRDRVDVVEGVLLAAGASAVTLLDAEDQPVHEPGPGEMPLWPDVVVRGLFPADLDRQALLDALVDDGLIDVPTDVVFEPLAEQDWERAWMDEYRPLRFGRDLWICPSHIEPDPDWPLVIRLDPGLAFGSGTHPTTALCLEWIDGQDLRGKTVIDFGCGSGVLAVACALKGATEVIAIDHDPQALEATAENARRNGVEALIQCCMPEQFEPRQADCVLANILAGVLVELAGSLMACVRPGGHLVLSGILAEQSEQVSQAYRDELVSMGSTQREDWMRLDFQRAETGS